MNASAKRRLPYWIESFTDFTSGTQSPLRFRTWAAIGILAGALERKVFMKAFKRTLYANLYILLIGGPGIGKTDALRNVSEFWEPLLDLHIAPSSVSRASLTDSLNNAARSILQPTTGTFEKFNSLQVCAEEFGTFLTQYETEFMSTLNHLYDCVRYTEKKRSMKDAIDIPKPHLNIIAATTPAWLSSVLPPTAWAEGFSSRLLMIFSQEAVKVDILQEDDTDEDLKKDLIHDLQLIHSMMGPMQMEEEFVERFRSWANMDFAPLPEHPKLEHYLPRRRIHFLKLCMILSVARSGDYTLRVVDFNRAQDLLLEAEAHMPDVFKSMTNGSDNNIIDETFSFVWNAYAKENQAITEQRIYHFISQRAPSYSVHKILEVMVNSGILVVAGVGTGLGGRNTYKPTPRASHNS